MFKPIYRYHLGCDIICTPACIRLLQLTYPENIPPENTYQQALCQKQANGDENEQNEQNEHNIVLPIFDSNGL